MDALRRTFLNKLGAAGALAVAATAGLKPGQAQAAEWNKVAFDAANMPDVLKATGSAAAAESKDLILKAPEHAENGAAVQLEVTSKIPNTTSIQIFVEKNPRPLVADCEFSNGAEPYVFIRTKMAETSRVRVQAKAGGKVYYTTKDIHVTTSGC